VSHFFVNNFSIFIYRSLIILASFFVIGLAFQNYFFILTGHSLIIAHCFLLFFFWFFNHSVMVILEWDIENIFIPIIGPCSYHYRNTTWRQAGYNDTNWRRNNNIAAIIRSVINPMIIVITAVAK